MYNLKTSGGSYKGFAGEIMFKLTRKNAVLTRYWSRQKFMQLFRFRLTDEQTGFLYDNWYSIDCIEVTDRPTIYEIKTKNEYNTKIPFLQKITKNTVRIYEEAQKIGFNVVSATVFFKENWDYEVEESEFDSHKYYIDKPKRYDKKSQNG